MPKRYTVTRVRDKTQSLYLLLRSTSWRYSHFFTCPILFGGHGFLFQTRQLTIPPFAFSSFRECAFYAIMMHYYVNRRVKHVLDACSMLSGMLFQLSWNVVPTYLEQESNLAVAKRELKKLTAKAYRVRCGRWRLEVGRVSCWW